MAKYVLYLNIGNLPPHKATEFSEAAALKLRESGIVEEEDKLVVFPVRDENTHLDLVP